MTTRVRSRGVTGSEGARVATLDFELEIAPGAADSYPVVARAPVGEAATTMRLSLTPTELDQQLTVVKDKVLVLGCGATRAH